MGDQPLDRDPWEAATWEGAAEATLRSGAELTLRERLAWLEEMGRMAEHLRRERHGPETEAPRLRT